MEHDRRLTHWTGQAVSWGNLLIATVAALVSMGGVVMFAERRFATLEQQYVQLRDDAKLRNDELIEMRRAINGKLDAIQSDLSRIQVEIARQGASAAATAEIARQAAATAAAAVTPQATLKR